MAYQGFLVDANGEVLGNTNSGPKNYDVIFRIWNDSAATGAGNRLWTEQQTVTVDKGYFSVLLGEGVAFPGEDRPGLSSVFAGPDASDRFVGITVKGVGPGTPPGDADILPRLRLLTSPYAFVAHSAANLVSPNGTNLASTANGELILNGALTVTGTITGNGSGLSGLAETQIPALTAGKIPALDASKITTGTFSSADRIPNLDASKITTGTFGSADRIPNLDASKITTGTLNSPDRIPNLPASKITSGAFAAGQIPTTLDGTRTFSGNVRVQGLTRAGNETGPGGGSPGLLARRVASTDMTAGSLVARTDTLFLERDGTRGGMRLRWTSNARRIICYTYRNASGSASLVLPLTSSAAVSGSVSLFSDASHVTQLDIMFGDTYDNEYFAHVVLIRHYDGTVNDNYWVGTLTTDYNQ